MNYGVIHHVVFEKGFGFIRPDRGPDIFFPAVAVQDGRFDFIGPEQPVKYELEKFTEEEKKVAKGPRAKIVVLIDKMPGGVLEDVPQTMRAKHHPKSRGRKATWKRKIDLVEGNEPLPPLNAAELLSEANPAAAEEPTTSPAADSPVDSPADSSVDSAAD